MNIDQKQPTLKGPAEWFTGDVYIDAIHVRKAEGATWLERVTDEQYKAAAAAEAS
jgi:hypothetical protein